jgi:hypothetical protein
MVLLGFIDFTKIIGSTEFTKNTKPTIFFGFGRYHPTIIGK